ncbi:polysaccharide biosynthesis/export family protein [Paludisphaera mucosa]|uniref:Polysaccharide biosynthesis/export family protein n=1 Tax=Paludisphaera mucosa TaxID=3030827 RepID=A0ABT6F7C2_9BACT|nr:polysaccharide biosynthesis/export family protein [Paludisphaera mucosa]MDG3003459.1 polysaccharide biosynthesis/export family protein [Paludisphaera mucosa]
MTRSPAPPWLLAAVAAGAGLALPLVPVSGQEAKPEPAQAPPAEKESIEKQITKVIEAYDLTPKPEPDIPDPPPHEGAMIDQPPYRIEPPDLILIEVLEALPARPISGERLVRPDGSITLGFYGEVHVRGLTIEQAKVKIIKHLRSYLSDDVLGLREEASNPLELHRPEPTRPSPPQCGPPQAALLSEAKWKVARVQGSVEWRDWLRTYESSRTDSLTRRWRQGGSAQKNYFARVALPGPFQEPGEQPAEATPAPAEEPAKAISVTTQGEVTIRIEVETKPRPANLEEPFVGVRPAFDLDDPINWRPAPPQENDRVFVDVTAYNSKNYFVLGDVAAPGKLPITGNETVLDAIQYAGGLVSSGDSGDVILVRPGRNGKPPRTYSVDLKGIIVRGETRTNYQIFPGDRLFIGRKGSFNTKMSETPTKPE